MVFIYWIEGHPDYADRVEDIYQEIRQRGDVLCTSVFTLGELLVGPKLKGNDVLEAQIRRLLTSSEIELIPLTEATMVKYAQIRATAKSAPADTIHLACASQAKVDLFITNDARLRKCVVPDVNFISGINGTVL